MVPLNYYLVLSALLFVVGVVGVVVKRNIITMFMSIELMLNAANLAFVAYARSMNRIDGQIFVFFILTVAAAEAGVGLAVIIALFRNRETLNVDDADIMKW